MNTPDPTGPRKITAEEPPQFPCWLYEPPPGHLFCWRRYTEPGHDFGLKTHWHPDQSTAPTVTPEGGEPVTFHPTDHMKSAEWKGPNIHVVGSGAVEPAPAESETPTPETDDAWETHNRGKCGLHYIAHKMRRLEAERDQARQQFCDEQAEAVSARTAIAKMCARVERGEFSEDCPFCLAKSQTPGVPNPMCHLCDLESERATLHHELAAAEALLEARTRALEFSVTAMACADHACPVDSLAEKTVRTAIVNAKNVLALTPEQALKEKEGAHLAQSDAPGAGKT